MDNDAQAEYWNGPVAQGWIRRAEAIDRMFAEPTRAALSVAGFRAGDHAVDLGCGCGGTSLEIARRVGPEGKVDAFDLSRPMLVYGERRAREAELLNLRFAVRDLQSGDLGQGADVAFSRFGLMFFNDPQKAFGNILDVLVPGGRLCFLAWAERERNPFFTTTQGPLLDALELEPPPVDTPGAFGLASPARTTHLLEAAGFEDVECEHLASHIPFGSAEEAFATLTDLSGRMRAQLDQLEPARVEALRKQVSENLAPYQTSDGLRIPAHFWLVTAASPLQVA